MPQIVVAGAPTGCWTNLGDEAILAGTARRLREVLPGTELVVVSSSPEGFFDQHGCRAVRYDDLDGIARVVAGSDLVLLGGGSIFFDYWGADAGAALTPAHQGVSLWTSVALLAAAHGTPLMVYGVGVGPLSTPDGRLLASVAFELADAITVRDHDALAALHELGVDAVPAQVTGDPALAVELPVPPATGAEPPVLGVAFRQWDVGVDPARWPVEVAAALDRHLARRGGEVVFIPCHRPVSWPLTDDAGAAQAVAARLAHADRTREVDVELPWDQRAALFGACDLVLAMRYHAALFAMAGGVPTVALSYDPKVAGFLADWGGRELTVPLGELTADALDERLARVAEERDVWHEHLTRLAVDHREAERANAERARGLVEADGDRRPPGPATRQLLDRLAEGGERPGAAGEALARLRATGAPRRAPASGADDAARHPTGTRTGTAGPRAARPRPAKRVAVLTNQLLDRQTGEPCIGGAERYALELGRLLAGLGLAPTFHQLGGGTWEEGDYFGFPVVALPQGEVYSEFQDGVGEAFYERTQDYDHVLYLMPNYASGPMRDDAVVVSHGVWWDHDLWGHLSFRTPEWYAHLERVFTRAERVVSVDVNTINVVRALFPHAAPRLTYVPSWVDTERFHPPARRDHEVPLVLFPRRADVIRGPQLVGPLLDLVPDPCRALWLGGGNEGLLAELHAVAERDPRFSVGSASFDEMPARYREADICVIPTVGSEGQSLACLEAMASGCAVVATRVGGLPELIDDGVDGLLCDPTPASLAAAVRRLVRDPQLRRRLGEAARARAERRSLARWRADWAQVLLDLGWSDDRTAAVPYDVVCFSVINWEFRWQRPQQLMTHWARRGRRVFFLRITDLLGDDDPPVVLDELAENVWEVRVRAPAGFDLHGASHPDELARLGLESLAALRERCAIDRAVSVVEHAGWTPLAVAARERWRWPVLYDCMDDWHTFPGFADSPTFLAAEARLVDEADAMVVSARTIQERWAARRPDAVLARNAVDFAFYEDADRAPLDDEIAGHLAGPVAGFIGAIAEWFDQDLVHAVARARPDVTFVFVGGVHRVTVDELEQLPNVEFVGQRPYEEMPGWIRRFDVCLVPFEVSPVTDGMDVVKLYEYLSQGKPVVTTPIREIVAYRDLVYLAATPDEFVRQLDAALAEDDPRRRARRIELARQNTWDERIDRFEELILPHVAPPTSTSPASPPTAPPPRRAADGDGDAAPAPGEPSSYWQEEAHRLRAELDAVHGSRAWRAANLYWRGLNRAKRLAHRLRERASRFGSSSPG